jgi:hypothetical protein
MNHRATESHLTHGTNHPPPQAKPVTSQATGTSEAVMATDGSDCTEASVSSRHSLASETNSQAPSQISQQDSSTVSSTSSAMDEISVAELSNCPSPTKKKHRSCPVTEETTVEQDDDNSVGDDVAMVQTTRRHLMVSTNLGTRFDSVIEHENTTPFRPSPSPESPDTPTTTDTVQYTQEAPLDPHYKAPGPAGADKT